jgi:CHAT domain-containing protein
LGEALLATLPSGTRSIALVPCGLLGLLPLHLAVLDTLEITYALSARSLLDTVAAADRPVEPFVAIGDPLGDLPHAIAEANAVTAGFAERTVLVGPAATWDAVWTAARAACCLHLACHGTYNPRSPFTSGLKLADRDLTLGDLLDEHPPILAAARLVVLSACDSAAVDPTNPDEVLGLPAAVIFAGAGAVVSSLWQIKDWSTAVFMAKFYELLRANGGSLPAWAPGRVLRETQLWMRAATARELLTGTHRLTPELRSLLLLFAPDDRPYADPQFWAPFVVVGA